MRQLVGLQGRWFEPVFHCGMPAIYSVFLISGSRNSWRREMLESSEGGRSQRQPDISSGYQTAGPKAGSLSVLRDGGRAFDSSPPSARSRKNLSPLENRCIRSGGGGFRTRVLR